MAIRLVAALRETGGSKCGFIELNAVIAVLNEKSGQVFQEETLIVFKPGQLNVTCDLAPQKEKEAVKLRKHEYVLACEVAGKTRNLPHVAVQTRNAAALRPEINNA